MARSKRFVRRAICSAMLALSSLTTAVFPLFAATAASAETAVAPEKNPPGDIPDSQVFITYKSNGGYALKVPEGWARKDQADGVSFVDKLDGIVLKVSDQAAAPTPASVMADYVPAMKKTGRAVKVTAVKAVKLPAGSAIMIAYSVNSEPNAVTSKQLRLEANRFLFFKDGKLVALDLYAPLGADNVDQWQLMSKSFKWN